MHAKFENFPLGPLLAPDMSREESESLLSADERVDTAETSSLLHRRRVSTRRTPLPKVQLGVVYAIKLVVPIAGTQLMPYINVLVGDLASADGAEVGYYTGLVGTANSAAHILTIYLWGRLSDTYGRKPVIIIGTAWTALFTLLFGVSRSFTTVLLTRFLVGTFSGTTGAIHSVVGELTDETNEATAFPLYDIVSAVGFAVGPLIGGTFSNPAEEFPRWFDTPFWRAYPYFLPCLVTASIALVALLLAVFVLEETLPAKRRSHKLPSSHSIDEEAHGHPPPSSAKPLGVRTLLSLPVIRMVCLSSGALAFVAGFFNTVFVLQAYTPVSQGGLALKPSEIGQALAVMGTVSIFLKLGMPALLRRLGVLTMFRICMRSWPITFAAMILLSVIARQVDAAGGAGRAGEWVAISFVLFLSRIGCMAFSIIMILTKDHTPGSSSLGTSNGMAEFAQSFAGLFSHAIISSLFAFSASKHVLGGYFWVLASVLISLLSNYPVEGMKKFRDD
ncbi:MFS general substrate transporter [Wolfiporia cocos MD-104 SS10]|uniref:MFS general substrate transporter n=1 Tax=Wolfiporia cocos (strain MD-104) TaxID=742152 RepID=A0A2H3J340_WOLCO|nr:MFS general substrate transporter [Wolfiporia cocos MD-104 SS10]